MTAKTYFRLLRLKMRVRFFGTFIFIALFTAGVLALFLGAALSGFTTGWKLAEQLLSK